MGYRDEYIRRIKECGAWDALPKSVQQFIEGLDDERAGRAMAEQDGIDADLLARESALSRPETREGQKAAVEFLVIGLHNLRQALNGDLLDGARLSPLGRAVADFFRVAKEASLGVGVEILVKLDSESALPGQPGVKLANLYCEASVAGFTKGDVNRELLKLTREGIAVLNTLRPPPGDN